MFNASEVTKAGQMK